MIYRVLKKKTTSAQPEPRTTFWQHETLYCGTDLEAARVAYLAAKPSEEWCGYGNRACEVTIEQFESEPEDIDDTTASEVED